MSASSPPVENPEAVRNRSWIIYSFWIVIILLGLPTWWQTTAIERSALPLNDMLSWSDTPENRPNYTVSIRFAAPYLPCEVRHKLARDIKPLINTETSAWGFEVSIELVHFPSSLREDQKAHGSSCELEKVIPEIQSTTIDLELRPGTAFSLDVSSGATPLLVTYNPEQLDILAVNLVGALRKALDDEEVTVAYQYHSQGRSDAKLADYVNKLPGEKQKLVQDSAARAFKSSPEYHLTFSLFTPGGTPSSWDIDLALDQYIQPILHALSKSTGFSIATQIQLYSAFSPSIQPYQEENAGGWFVRKNDLTAFVNTAEWPLSPSIGSGPTINFVLYVPSKQQTPLWIEGFHGSSVLGGSWVVPQWGGISILNAPIVKNDPEVNREDVIAHLSLETLKPAFDVFHTQLLILLGVPTSSSTSLPLRLKAWQRLSALSLHLRTGSNLGSLARLAQHLSNIPIPRHVSDLVESAIHSLSIYRDGNGKETSMIAANNGYKASEKAFFDKSMVGQVYFPEEHKVAVYLPLLGPIGVPLVVGLIRELKALKARMRV